MSVETQNFASLQIVFLLLFAAIGSLSAQGLSLDSCRRLALHNNVAVRNAALDVEAAAFCTSSIPYSISGFRA